jgi:hypothetical protein
MLIHSAGAAEFEYFPYSSTSIVAGRLGLVKLAADWRADWILWLDADHQFPPDTLKRLLAHNKPVVACNYRRRDNGMPTANRRMIDAENAELIQTNKLKVEKLPLEPAMSAGLGVCLVSMEAIRSIKGAIFSQEYFPDGRAKTAEDGWFFAKLKEAGHQLYIDHALSMEIGHETRAMLKFSG